MNGQWSKEKAWQWYNARPWIRGCNYMPSDCANRVDEWQEFGFAQRLETAKRELPYAPQYDYQIVNGGDIEAAYQSLREVFLKSTGEG